MPSFRCVVEDGQDFTVEQVEFDQEREITRSPYFIKSVEDGVSLTDSGNDFFGCGSLIFDDAAKVFEVDYLFYIVVTAFFFIGESLVSIPLFLLALELTPNALAFC